MISKGLGFLGAMVTVWSVSAAAYTVGEVSCLEGGCLAKGWVARDLRSGQTAFVDCYDGDCAVHGWMESYSNSNQSYEVICNRDGCFNDGWMTYDRYTHQAVSSTRCMVGHLRTPDCMSGGWVAREYYYGSQIMSYCVNYDCAHEGWFVYLPNGAYQRSYCKQGACFEYGWVTDQR